MANLKGSSLNVAAMPGKAPVDPGAILTDLETDPVALKSWEMLQRKLVDEGVNESSYAAVPRLVRIGLVTKTPSWELMALVASIELARVTGVGSPLPEQMSSDYMEAVTSLMLRCLESARQEKDPFQIRGMLGLVALYKGCSTYATAILEYSEGELGEFFLPFKELDE